MRGNPGDSGDQEVGEEEKCWAGQTAKVWWTTRRQQRAGRQTSGLAARSLQTVPTNHYEKKTHTHTPKQRIKKKPGKYPEETPRVTAMKRSPKTALTRDSGPSC